MKTGSYAYTSLNGNGSPDCNCNEDMIAGFLAVMENNPKDLTANDPKLKAIHDQTAISIGLGFALVGLGVVCAVFGIVAVCAKGGGFTLDNMALLGSYLQGSVSALWSLAGLLFIYAAFLGQREQLRQQEKELEDQKKQFELQQESTKRHNILSVTPYLMTNNHTDRSNDGLTITVDLCNHGIGPAKIKTVTLFLDGKVFSSPKGNPIEELVKARVAGKQIGYEVRKCACPKTGYCIIVGQVYRMLELFIPRGQKSDEAKLDEILNGTDLRIEYESFYGVSGAFDTRG